MPKIDIYKINEQTPKKEKFKKKKKVFSDKEEYKLKQNLKYLIKNDFL